MSSDVKPYFDGSFPRAVWIGDKHASASKAMPDEVDEGLLGDGGIKERWNLITNPSFESGKTTSWYWAPEACEGTKLVHDKNIDSSEVFAGEYALAVNTFADRPNGFLSWFGDDFANQEWMPNLTSASKVEFSMWVKPEPVLLNIDVDDQLHPGVLAGFSFTVSVGFTEGGNYKRSVVNVPFGEWSRVFVSCEVPVDDLGNHLFASFDFDQKFPIGIEQVRFLCDEALLEPVASLSGADTGPGMNVNVDGTYKSAKGMWINVDGSWHQITGGVHSGAPGAPTNISVDNNKVSWSAGTAGTAGPTLAWSAEPSPSGPTVVMDTNIDPVSGGACYLLDADPGVTYTLKIFGVNSVGAGHPANSPGVRVTHNNATGGSIQDITNWNGTGETWRVHTFTKDDTFSVFGNATEYKILACGGGGSGGGYSSANGGGGGGKAKELLKALPFGEHRVTVGGGGQTTSLATLVVSQPGNNGGNGPGGSGGASNYGGGKGSGVGNYNEAAGGGGGAGSGGGSAGLGGNGGRGGNGLKTVIRGKTEYFGGGGGGGTARDAGNPGSGGAGGGGHGGKNEGAGSGGSANTGGGGGDYRGGGSGILIVAYRIA